MTYPLASLPQQWRIPDCVELGSGELLCTYDQPRPRATEPWDDGLLDRFLLLHKGSDETILEYAQDNGVLNLCEHQRPADWCCRTRGPESLAGWQEMSEAFAGLLGAARALEVGEPVTEQDQRGLEWFVPGNAAHLHVARATSQLIEWGVHLRAAYRHGADRPHLFYAATSLADGLALQCAVAVCRAKSSFICDGCQNVFTPARQPRHGQRKFCETCRTNKVPEKIAKRDLYDRRRKAAANPKGQP